MASSPQHEPTMEEILASIRKIISEDSTEAAPPPPAQAAAAAPEPEIDVLDLTHEVHEEPLPVEPPVPGPVVTQAPPAPEFQPVQQAAPEPAKPVENDVVFQTIEESPVSEAPAVSTAAHEGFFSEKTRKALEDSFATIQQPKAEPAAAVADVQPAAPVADGASVQAVFEKAVKEGFEPVLHQWLGDNSDAVIEKLKPLVRQWMDDHFPALLEGAVRAEVERVARARH